MIALIVYDITDDDSRTKISKYLESVGQRVQESVFECKISTSEIDTVTSNIANLIKLPGSVRIYPLCQECFSKVLHIGHNEKIGENGYVVF
ncbi:MAG: CRISPR-associated endonuclease Cas2 [Candidatus Marinimicrobia bacterium CG08_land_8_20_14_0_20_45_22]|nr:MAG: CRISPR-associated endonuclease Cas2 [Candidatus Marinimicrobia bacterium CG08_land_8_20_14_0_20_45_22]